MLDIWLAFVVPCANAVVAIPSAIVANVRAEFAVVVVFPNAIPNSAISLLIYVVCNWFAASWL